MIAMIQPSDRSPGESMREDRRGFPRAPTGPTGPPPGPRRPLSVVPIWSAFGPHPHGKQGSITDTPGHPNTRHEQAFWRGTAGRRDAPNHLAKVGVAGSNPVVRSTESA